MCTQPDRAELPAAKIQKIGYLIFFFGSIIILSCIMDAQAEFGLLKTQSKALLYSCKSHGLQIEAFSSVSSTMLSNEIPWLQQDSEALITLGKQSATNGFAILGAYEIHEP